MVEVVTAALEDQLIDPLSFRLTKPRLILQNGDHVPITPRGQIFIIQLLEQTYKNSIIRDRLVRPKHISYNV